MKRYIKANREPVTEEVVKLLSSLEGTYTNPTTGWSGTVTYDYDGYDNVNNAYVWVIRFEGDSGSSPSVDYLYRYTGNDHRAMFMLMPDSGMPLFADSVDELKSVFRKEYSYLKKTKVTASNVTAANGRMLELSPIDGRNSFYGKAKVLIDNDGTKTLYSYDTPVCKVYPDDTVVRLWDGYSATTMRHVNAFMDYCGIRAGGKKWWESLELEY